MKISILVLLIVPSFFSSFGIFASGIGERKSTTITLWTTEEQPERLEVQEGIAEQFKRLTGITVKVVPVTQNLLGERVIAAYSAGELPDVIYHPLNLAPKWYKEGILDAAAATEVIQMLNPQTYSTGALNLVKHGDEYAAVPVDGWAQLIVYRKDLFDKYNLPAPSNYKNILQAIEVLHNPPQLYGFVVATDPSQVYMMQVFEFIALANGVQLINADGDVSADSKELRETLRFYKKLVAASPPGNLYWQQSRELYLAGKTAMIIWSPFILDELAGLRDSVPVTATLNPTSDDLAKRTGALTQIAGPSNPQGAGWIDISYFGITIDANIDASKRFVAFSMNEAYVDTLAIAPEGKFPIRRGIISAPNKFQNAWSNLEVGVDRKKALKDIYPTAMINAMVDGLNKGSRWAIKSGHVTLLSTLYDTRGIAELVREYTDGKRSVEETARLIAKEVQDNL